MRTELWHPLLVHLPVVTLLLVSIAGLLHFMIKNTGWTIFLMKFIELMTLLGVLGGWAAIYTGQLAYNIEVRKICDPKVLQEHQFWSYAAIITYSVLLLLLIVQKFTGSNVILRLVAAVCFIFGFSSLCYAGHLGARVVYEQGAGVHKPKEDCSDYILQ